MIASWGKLLAFILLISGCATNTQQKINTDAFEETWEVDQSSHSYLVEAKRNIKAFENANPREVIVPYVQLVNQLQLVGEEEICSEQNVERYQTMYELNPSSIFATSLLFNCEVGTAQDVAHYLLSYEAILTVLLSENNGSSFEKAVKIREISEAELILSTADYTILDSEIIPNGDRFKFRLHAVDNDSGEFEYHYYDNFDFLKKIFQSYLFYVEDKQVSEAILKEFSKQKDAAIVNLMSTELLREKKYQEVIDFLEKIESLSPISNLNLARAYLYTQQDEKLMSLVDSIFEQKDLGDVNSAVFLAELIYSLNGSSENSAEIEELIKDVAKRTRAGEAEYLLAKSFLVREKVSEFESWALKALQKNSTFYYSKIVQEYEFGKLKSRRIDFVKRAHLLNIKQATHDLALSLKQASNSKKNIKEVLALLEKNVSRDFAASIFYLGHMYFYGDGVVEDKLRAKQLIQNSAEKGYKKAVVFLAENFKGV